MTKEELLERLRSINSDKSLDEDSGHVLADELLVEYINDEEIGEAFDAVFKWYS